MKQGIETVNANESGPPADGPAPAECTLEFRVRYPECDPMGLLHHAKYLEYFEMGRTELLRLSGLTYRDLEARGFLLVVAQVECRYRAPVRYDDVVSLRTRLVKLTRARIDHEYEMAVEGRLVCQARTTIACVDRAGRLQPVPDEICRRAPADRETER